MVKIAVMGDKESIYGFAALGMDVFPVEDPGEAGALLHRLAANEFGVIYITEALAAAIPDAVDAYRYSASPAVILIPGVQGNTGAGMRDLNKAVEKAVGSNILK
ncbi:MAG: V-type ATP synthase subunit F [Acutalibacteraceae bacterium]|jgi:V/A-type H+-transporting ATPase subunit F